MPRPYDTHAIRRVEYRLIRRAAKGSRFRQCECFYGPSVLLQCLEFLETSSGVLCLIGSEGLKIPKIDLSV